MARGGSKPGERRGGRQAGVPNKATLERETQIALQRRAEGQMLSKDAMALLLNNLMALASVELKELADLANVPNLDVKDLRAKRKIVTESLVTAAGVAADLMPYESPRLATVTVRDEMIDLAALSDEELTQLELIRTKAAVTGINPVGEGTTRH